MKIINIIDSIINHKKNNEKKWKTMKNNEKHRKQHYISSLVIFITMEYFN